MRKFTVEERERLLVKLIKTLIVKDVESRVCEFSKLTELRRIDLTNNVWGVVGFLKWVFGMSAFKIFMLVL